MRGAGRKRNRLKLQQQVETQDSLGGAIITWSTTATVWGAVEALSGSENFTADQVQSSLQVRIVIPSASDWSGINTTWRVMDANNSRKYDIKAVMLPAHRSHFESDIELMCFEGDTDDG